MILIQKQIRNIWTDISKPGHWHSAFRHDNKALCRVWPRVWLDYWIGWSLAALLTSAKGICNFPTLSDYHHRDDRDQREIATHLGRLAIWRKLNLANDETDVVFAVWFGLALLEHVRFKLVVDAARFARVAWCRLKSILIHYWSNINRWLSPSPDYIYLYLERHRTRRLGRQLEEEGIRIFAQLSQETFLEPRTKL